MTPKFKIGQLVKLVNTSKMGVICEDVKIISGENYYVLFVDNLHKTYSEESLELAGKRKIDVPLLFQEKKFGSLEDFMSFLTYIKVERPLSNNLYAFLSSRTEFQVHQFKPLLKYLSSPYQRLLIADEVGVGKTIEAGIIYTELLSRQQNLNNVLIICPSSLQYKWQKELKNRFNEEFALIDSKTLKLFFRKYERFPNGVNIKGIASIQMLRNEEIFDELERLQITWDLILIDEAHHLRNEETSSNNLGRILSSNADGMIMLSATPLQLGNKDLFNLLNILLPEEFDNSNTFEEQMKPNEFINLALLKISRNESPKAILDALHKIEETNQKERFLSNPNYNSCIKLLSTKDKLDANDIAILQRKISELNVLSQVYTRTKKKEITIETPIREPVTIKVEFNNEEKLFYEKVSELFLRLNPGCPPGFLLQMPLRQVASCIPATIEYLNEIYHNGNLFVYRDEEEEDFSEERKLILTKQDLVDIKELLLFAHANIKEPDSKTIAFINTIQEILDKNEIKKIIIFSFFKKTLKYLEKKLKFLGLSVARIDGDIPIIEREKIIEKFSEPNGYSILLSSEVGGEGLDMQFCNCMFNYDLPWNPMRIEQRIGRLDRYGQKSPKIHIYNFSVENTVESNIFLRLCNRIGVFEQYIGELEPILGNAINQLTREIINTKLTPEQQKEKADHLAIVIEKKKQELELFDKERKKFIGQDNFFTERVSDILRNEEFITPSEIINLINTCIKEKYPKSKFGGSKKEDGIYEIKPDSELKYFIKDYINKTNLGTEFTERFLELLSKDSIEIAFDYKVANANPSIEFVTLRHPLVKAIIDLYKHQEFKNITKITYLDNEALQEKDYLFYIYLLELTSFTKSLTFVPVVVDLESKIVNSNYSDKLFQILKSSIDIPGDIAPSREELISCEDSALNYVIERKRTTEHELREINESLVNDRLSSLKQTFEIKMKKLDETIIKLKNNLDEKSIKILRMKESQKMNLTRNYESKRKNLESDKKVTVSHELVCGGYLNVKC